MATFVLIHGGGGSAWDWHRLAPELAARGHEVVTPDLPIENPSAGFADFRDSVVNAVGDRRDLVVVGHSYGGFTAPLVAEKLPVRLLALLSAMVPAPRESPRDWWDNTRYRETPDLSDEEKFYNRVPADFQHRIAVERLGITPDSIDGGHAVALSHPKDLADRLASYLDISGGQGPRR